MCHKTDFGRAPHGSAEALPPETEVLPQLRSNFAVQVFPERTADAEALPHDVPQNRLRSRSPRQRGGFAP